MSTVGKFAGKIKAAQHSKVNEQFTIARTEALIAGMGVDGALERAASYYQACADAIFIHSKEANGSDVLEFGRRRNRKCFLLVAPTTYFNAPLTSLEEAGVSIYICANQLMRASVYAMRQVAYQIRQENNISTISDSISSRNDVFGL